MGEGWKFTTNYYDLIALVNVSLCWIDNVEDCIRIRTKTLRKGGKINVGEGETHPPIFKRNI